MRDKSYETKGHCHESPYYDRYGHHNAVLDAMSWVLRRAARSPFFDEIKRTKMVKRFTRPPFTNYDGKIDLMEHVSHSIQMMSLYF